MDPAPHGASTLDLMFKGGEVSSSTHPEYPSFHNLQEHNDASATYVQCVKGDTDVKVRGTRNPSKARQPQHHCAQAPF